jgi:hypothetical protein
MAIPEANIHNTGSLAKMLDSIKTAGVPERVTVEFLKTLGFKSSNDRPIISILKGIGFLDTNGKPTEQYKAYRSHDGARILASAVRNAYADIFLANTKAQSLPLDKLKGIIASKTSKGDASVERIARTFQVLAKAADWSAPTETSQGATEPEQKEEGAQSSTSLDEYSPSLRGKTPSFHYNLEIHLPTTTDITVYNAIFKSLKDNLL